MSYVVKDRAADVWSVMRKGRPELVTPDHNEALALAAMMNLLEERNDGRH